MQIGITIRDLRLADRLSQADIRKRTGISPSYLSRVENGRIHPTLDTLERIAGALELSLSELCAAAEAGAPRKPTETSAEQRFISEIRRYARRLTPKNRKLVLQLLEALAGSPHGRRKTRHRTA